MSEVERYWIDPSRLVQEGWHQDDTCVVKDWAYDRVVAERNALQQRLTAADERVDVLEGRVAMLRHEMQSLISDDDGILVAAELSTGFAWHALQKHGGAIKAALTQEGVVAAPDPCTWKFGAFSWHTGCGTEWMLNDGTPEQNGMRFCHSCGKTLVVEGEGHE